VGWPVCSFYDIYYRFFVFLFYSKFRLLASDSGLFVFYFFSIPSIGYITCVCIIVVCDTVSRVWINLFLQREVVLAARVNPKFVFYLGGLVHRDIMIGL